MYAKIISICIRISIRIILKSKIISIGVSVCFILRRRQICRRRHRRRRRSKKVAISLKVEV